MYGKIHANEPTSTHPAFNGAPVKITQRGFPSNDPNCFMEVELLDDWPKTHHKKGERVSVRTRDFVPDPSTLEEKSEQRRNRALAKRDASYISGWNDDGWGFGG